jgi:hypothetical protein
MSKRCDGIQDCSLRLDESNCTNVIIDKVIYRSEYPPVLPDGSLSNVTINFTIISLGNFAEMESTYTLRLF